MEDTILEKDKRIGKEKKLMWANEGSFSRQTEVTKMGETGEGRRYKLKDAKIILKT